MKIVEKSLTEEALEQRDYSNILEIYIDGKCSFSVSDGEPEDANLARDFNDCCSVSDLMRKAYDAGKNGESFEIEYEKLSEDEI